MTRSSSLVVSSSVGILFLLLVVGGCVLLVSAVNNSEESVAVTTREFGTYEDFKTAIAGNWKYCPIGNGFQYSADYEVCQRIRLVCPNNDAATSTSELFFNNCGCGCYHSNCGNDNKEACEFGDLLVDNARKSEGDYRDYEIWNVTITNDNNNNAQQTQTTTTENARIISAGAEDNNTEKQGAADSTEPAETQVAAVETVTEIEAETTAATATTMENARIISTGAEDNTVKQGAAAGNTEPAPAETTQVATSETETEKTTPAQVATETNVRYCQHNKNTPFRDIVDSYPYAMRVTLVKGDENGSSLYTCVDEKTTTTTTATNMLVPTTNSDVVKLESRGMRPSMYATGYYTVNVVEIFHDDTQPDIPWQKMSQNFVLFYENEEGNYRKEWEDANAAATDSGDDNSFLIFPVSVPKAKKCYIDDNNSGANNMYTINKCTKGFRYSSLNQDDLQYLKTMAKEVVGQEPPPDDAAGRVPTTTFTVANGAAQNNSGGSSSRFSSNRMMMCCGVVLIIGSFLF